MSKNNHRKKLIGLGAEALSDALLELAVHSQDADDLVERLIATPGENAQRFKKKLARLKRSKRFINWRGVAEFARGLEALLQDLKAGIQDPLTGVELVAAFYETDEHVLGNCDDSTGHVGDVFRFAAKELFVAYAARCTEKEKVTDIILRLNREDDYGVRGILIECAGEYLPEPMIRTMISELQKQADNESEDYKKRHYFMLVESLARQVKDAKLFEKTRIASWGELPAAARIDIGRVYLESGDLETALSWLEKIPGNVTTKAYERDKLLLEIYKQQNNTEKQAALLHRNFESYPSTDTLHALLDVIGHDKREKIIADEVARILKSKVFQTSDAGFLISTRKIDETEAYLLTRAGQLNGEYYERLLPLAKTMASENRNLAASVIYRSLLIAILNRGYTKAYPHGVRYLKKLDEMAVTITDWQDFDHHDTFKEHIHKAHGRKRSFWSKYQSQL
ncbi:MAG: DUF6880 family protein [Desulfobacter sp.]